MNATSHIGIAYEVVRSERSTADIIIERDGSVVVRAPDWAEDEAIEGIVASRAYWIFQNLAEWRELNAARVVRELKNGEGFLYLGRSYRLLLVDDGDAPVALKNGRLCVQRHLVEQANATAARAAIERFFTLRGEERLRRRVAYFAPKTGVTPGDVAVRELGNRWASCSPSGDLAFHWKVMMAPATVVDYVVVHELCHLRHRDHSEAFWNEVDKVMPDYGERKEWLRKNGAGLDL